MNQAKRILPALLLFLSFLGNAQNVPILNYSENSFGQVQLEIQAQADKYYTLTALHGPNLNYETVTSMTLGVDGLLTISEPAGAYPLQNYKITEYSVSAPDDIDGDGIDDISEFNDMPTNAPLNFAEAIAFIDGTTSIDNAETFESMAVVEDVPWAPFLNGQQFVKFGILDIDTDEPKVYFINSETHFIHADFFTAIGANVIGDDGSGEIVYNPNEILPNGAIGSYSFNFSFGDAKNFETTQKTYELLVANMPFLKNNMQHFIGQGGEVNYNNLYKDDYLGSRINVVLESDVFADIDFIPLNQAEGYGFFRQMQLDENPGSRDIVLYDALPNSLPRVGGIITSVVQTPLSHVNLRAIQDNLPNAYIKEPLMIDSIANLIGNYIYYKVEQDQYIIREATLDEVNDWYDNIRPTEDQIPERDLTQTSILPLDEIDFTMSNAFGAKCANVATMRSFGFPEGTIPDGYGVPFFYYDEFMKFNNFYDQAAEMIANDDFINDLETRIEMLKEFRKEIRAADMPLWMLDDLQAMHDSFPEGTAVRCRSSTNNEDLPGFSGAGLYTSKTQHLDEGHISKSIKQVYASMWNFRAFDERDFYRVDHFIAAMGVLCHPNYQEEKSNGVGISLDPIFGTDSTYYLNTQVGEALITNPGANEIPEEILLNENPNGGYFVLRYSNLVPNAEDLVMNEAYLEQLRGYLKIIHDEFEVLYNVVGAEGYGMDIEYKVTAQDQLIIKQARPWVSFWSEIKANNDLAVIEITDPKSSSSLSDTELISAKVANEGLRNMKDFELSLFVNDQVVETLTITDELMPQSEAVYTFTTPQDLSTLGDYNIGAIVEHPEDGYSKNDTLITTISKIHLLEGSIEGELINVKCGNEVDVLAKITNYGEESFTNTEIEVVVNGLAVDTVNYDFTIPYQVSIELTITVTDNLMSNDNEISLNLIRVNGQEDAVNTNNSTSIITDLDSEFDVITLVINPDDYPEETTWQLVNEDNGQSVASGFLTTGQTFYEQDICVSYNSCYSLYVFDTYADGICCFFGQGNFSILDNNGQTLVYNDGDFGAVAEEYFCPGGECLLTAEIETTDTSGEFVSDGSISITASNGIEPYQYSIDGGITFFDSSVFNNLPIGNYMVVVKDSSDECIYEETVEVEIDIMINVNELEDFEIKIYPNPSSDNFTFELNSTIDDLELIKIEIYNGLGQLIAKQNLDTQTNYKSEISLSDFPAGTYFAKCFNREIKHYFRLIKL